MLRLQHSLLTHWFLTEVGAFYASPLISNDFVGNPFASLVGEWRPAAPPHGRANPQRAQILLPQRPKRVCWVNRFTRHSHFARNCNAFRLISGGRPCSHALPLPRRCGLPSLHSLLRFPTIPKGFAHGSANVALSTCNAPSHS